MSISGALVPALQMEFGASSFQTGAAPDAVAVFPAVCEDVGDLSIFDHDEEATIVVGAITHTHINPYDSKLSPEEVAHWVTEQVIEFLHDLFEDRIVVWPGSSPGLGGMKIFNETASDGDAHRKRRSFVWSRELVRPRNPGFGHTKNARSSESVFPINPTGLFKRIFRRH